MVYGGLLDMLTPNRLRALQRLNEEVVGGSGVFYFNALWRQVRGMCPSVQTARNCACRKHKSHARLALGADLKSS